MKISTYDFLQATMRATAKMLDCKEQELEDLIDELNSEIVEGLAKQIERKKVS